MCFYRLQIYVDLIIILFNFSNLHHVVLSVVMIPDQVPTVDDVYCSIIECEKQFPKKCWAIT